MHGYPSILAFAPAAERELRRAKSSSRSVGGREDGLQIFSAILVLMRRALGGTGYGNAEADLGRRADRQSIAAFDLRSAAGRSTGVGRYLLSIALAATDLQGVRVRAYLGKTELDLPPQVEKVVIGSSGLRWHLAAWRHLQAHPVDAYVSTSLVVPAFPRVRALPVVLDVSCFRVPQYQQLRTRLFEHLLLGRVVRRHPLIFGTDAARCDVKDLFREAHGTVVPPWFPMRARADENESALARLGARKPYLLIVGTLEPRKNVSLAVRTARELRARGHDLQLVIVGSRGWARQSEIREIRAAEAAGIVIWPGYVSDDERDALYAGATALLLPSVYEGFGMPLIEAMAAGLPCVCSEIAVFDEVSGGVALRADPRNPTEWADRVEELIGKPELALKLRAAGLERASFFSRERTALAFSKALALKP